MLSTLEILSLVYQELFFEPLGEASPQNRTLVQSLASAVDGGTTSLADAYDALVQESKGVAGAIASAYKFLTGEIPTDVGMTFLVEAETAGDFGRFNVENRYINQFNALAQGNPEGTARITALLAPEAAGDGDLIASITSLYDATIENFGTARDAAIAFLTRADALAFYRGVAQERILGSSNPANLSLDQAAAVVALGSIMNIAVRSATNGLGSEIDGYLGTRAANATPLTLFTGELDEPYPDGTTTIAENNFLRSSLDDPTTVSVLGGADLAVTGEFFQLRGQGGSVLAAGTGTSIAFQRLGIADLAGNADSASLTIEHGASVTAERLQIAGRAVFTGDDGSTVGVVGGSSRGDLNILDGGKLVVAGFANFASYFADAGDLNSGAETAVANVLVSGAGSSMTLEADFAQFGTVEGGRANVIVSDGGRITFFGGAEFGNYDNNSNARGGEGSLTIVGATSAVVNQANGIAFARGEGSVGHLTVAAGARLDAGVYLDFASDGQRPAGEATALIQDGALVTSTFLDVGRNGEAVVTIDGASVQLAGKDAEGFGAFMSVGRAGGSGSLSIVDGGSLLIDGQHSLSPGFTLGRDDGTGLLVIDGAGSKLTVTGDAPDLTDQEGFTGETHITIGRDGGTGTLEITDGGLFQNTVAGFLHIGRNGGTGSALIDGVGSTMNAGNGLRIGNQGDGHVEVLNAAILATSDEVFDGDADIRIHETGRLDVANAASVRGDVSNDGAVFVDATRAGNTLNGDFSQGDGGELQFKVGVQATAASLAILGAAALDGGILIDFTGSTLAVGQSVVLFEAAQGISVDDTLAIIFQGLSSSLDAQIVFDGDVARLTVGAANAFADDFVIV